ncbi:unnamed protein product, partial [Phaeothamnion confervicola]
VERSKRGESSHTATCQTASLQSKRADEMLLSRAIRLAFFAALIAAAFAQETSAPTSAPLGTEPTNADFVQNTGPNGPAPALRGGWGGWGHG